MQRKRPTSTKKKKKKRKPQRSTKELIRDGDHAVDVELDPTKAVRLYTLALPQLQEDSSPRSEYVRVLTRLGEAKVSLGDPDDAKQHFLAALEAGAEDQPSQEHANLYLYLGQLSVEQEALEMYEKGIGALETAIANDDGSMTDEDNTNRVQLLRRQLCQAHCSLSELYMTDLCFAEEAEQACELHVGKALEMCPDQLDALQTAASLRLSQKRGEEAVSYMQQVYSQLRVGCEALAALVGLGGAESRELVEVEAADGLPGFEFRCQTAKLLLECGATGNSECVPAAIQVLGSLLAENDEVVEIWYLLGCAYMELKETELASQYWARALEMLKSVQASLELEQDGSEDDDVKEQLEDVRGKIEEIQTKMHVIEQEEEGQEMEDG